MRDLTDCLAQLRSSHRRLEEVLRELRGAAARLPDTDGPQYALDVARDAHAYFERSGLRHEADEELSLFPRLAEDAELAPVLVALTEEHREQEGLIAELGAIAAGARPIGELTALAERLDAAYARHIAREDQVLFPRAAHVLGEEALAAIAGEMAARRPRGGGGGGGGRGGGGGGGGGGGRGRQG